MDNKMELEGIRATIDELRAFRFRTHPEEIAKLHQTLAMLERRIEALELNHGATDKRADVPLWLQEAVKRGLPGLTGKLSASTIAQGIGIPADHATLIRLGRYLQTLGYKRGRSGDVRWFDLSAP